MAKWGKRLILVAVAFVTFSGCLPQKLILWSPDGKCALILATSRSYLADAAGKLSRTDIGFVYAGAWLKDSRRALLAVSRQATAWQQLADVLDEQTLKETTYLAGKLRTELLACPDSPSDEQLQETVKAALGEDGYLLLAISLYLRDRNDPPLRRKLGESRWADVRKIEAGYCQLQLFGLRDGGFEPGDVVLGSLRTITDVRLSPDERSAALTLFDDREKQIRCQLWLAAVQKRAVPMRLGWSTAAWPDWSPDGQQVVCIASAQDRPLDGKTLGDVCVVALDEKGQLKEQMIRNSMAQVLFSHNQRVRWLANGDILFSGAKVQLPSASSEATQGLFLLKGEHELIALYQESNRQPFEMQMGLFELNADQSLASLPGKGCELAVLVLAEPNPAGAKKGELIVIQGPQNLADKPEFKGVPSWRGKDEISFAIPPGWKHGTDRYEVGLAKIAPQQASTQPFAIRLLSKDWPAETVADFVGRGGMVSGPASAPSLSASQPARLRK